MACHTPSEDQHSPPSQSPEWPTGPPQQISREADQFTLPTRENNRLPLSDVVEEVSSTPVVTLHRSSYIVLVVSIYASVALTAWILVCVLTFRPLTTARYGYNALEPGSVSILARYPYALWLPDRSDPLHAKYVKSEAIYRAARTVQSVITVLTIPLTSAVCSAAAVVFAQCKTKGRRLTMRQMMALADKGWTDPTTIARLVTGRGKQLSSPLLTCALLLVLLGASTTILQTLFMSQKTVKIPSQASSNASRVFDISSFSERDDSERTVAAFTQYALREASRTTPQPHLWQEGVNCSSSTQGQAEPCILETSAFGNFTALSNPYLASLPVGFHTGLVKQLIPRINSTVEWEIISSDNVFINCVGSPNSFHALYAKPPGTEQDAQKGWSIEICMPGDQSALTWKNTNLRQDFTEELLLNISVMGYDSNSIYSIVHRTRDVRENPLTGGIFRVTSKTTAGYFELPNYMNGGQAGPIIDGQPDESEHCGFDCEPQVSTPWTTSSPVTTVERGPLLTVAIALFGNNSTISTKSDLLETLLRDGDDWRGVDRGSGLCADQMPLSPLLDPTHFRTSKCLTDYKPSVEMLDIELAAYVGYFSPYGDRVAPEYRLTELSSAFGTAVFLANEDWLVSSRQSEVGSRYVYTNSGVAMVIPAISRAGMIVVSSLWAVYIACLLSLAVYSAKSPRWTNHLDAFAMMRIGIAAKDERIALKVGFKTQEIDALDDLPGMMGDATGGEGEVGVLGLGASTPLNGVRLYESYRYAAKAEPEPVLEETPTHVEIDGKFHLIRATEKP